MVSDRRNEENVKKGKTSTRKKKMEDEGFLRAWLELTTTAPNKQVKLKREVAKQRKCRAREAERED